MDGLQTKWAVVAVMALCLYSSAQTTADTPEGGAPQNTAPAPAYGFPNPAVLTPENPPVSTLDLPALEPNLQPRSMLEGGVVGSEALDTNVNENLGASSAAKSVTRLAGGLTLHRLWERYNFGAAYVGGVGFYSDANPTVRNFQELQAQQAISWKTGQATLRDSFSYLPEGSFGAGAFGGASGFSLGLGGLGTGSGQLGSGLGGRYGVAGGTQYGSLGQSPRISNVTIADVIQELSPRSAVTAAGSFGVVHFTGQNPNGFINTNSFGGDVGYSYAISRRDQVGVVFGVSGFRYPSGSGAGAVDSRVLEAIYGHRISGRMALLLGGGPLWTSVQDRVRGNTTSLSASVIASLRYQLKRATLGLTYRRGNTTGSGFFAGAESDIVVASATYPIARRWSSRFDAGYSHHNRLQTAMAGVNAGSYEYFFAGAGIEREFNRNLAVFVAYQYNEQLFGGLVCSGNCNNLASRQVLQFGAAWHFRPIRLD